MVRAWYDGKSDAGELCQLWSQLIAEITGARVTLRVRSVGSQVVEETNINEKG
jgi:hypothetical protein